MQRTFFKTVATVVKADFSTKTFTQEEKTFSGKYSSEEEIAELKKQLVKQSGEMVDITVKKVYSELRSMSDDFYYDNSEIVKTEILYCAD